MKEGKGQPPPPRIPPPITPSQDQIFPQQHVSLLSHPETTENRVNKYQKSRNHSYVKIVYPEEKEMSQKLSRAKDPKHYIVTW